MVQKLVALGISHSERSLLEGVLGRDAVLVAQTVDEILSLLADDSSIDCIFFALDASLFAAMRIMYACSIHSQVHLLLYGEPEVLDTGWVALHANRFSFLAKPLERTSLLEKLKTCEKKTTNPDDLDLIKDQAQLFNAIFWQAPIGIAISHGIDMLADGERETFQANPRFEEITGRTGEELKQMGWASITHPDDVQKDLCYYEQLKRGEISSYAMEKRYIKPDGSIVWADIVVAPLSLHHTKISTHICLVQDITKHKQTEISLYESERSKSVLLSHLPGMAYRCSYDQSWTMLYISAGCKELTGYEPEQLLNNRDLSFNDIIVESYRAKIWHEWKQQLPQHRPFRFEYEIRTAEGNRKWVWEMGQGVYSQQDEVVALEGIILDISERKKMEQELAYREEHDYWTELPNRQSLERILELDAQSRSSDSRVLVSVNLGPLHAKSITYGFQYSQDIMKKIAGALLSFCSPTCKLFITHEYRFVFYCKGDEDRQHLSRFCKEVSNILMPYVSMERIAWGIGIIEITKEMQNREELLRNLLIASEKALTLFDEEVAICYFDSEMETAMYREETIIRALSKIAGATGNDRLFLLYQPVYDLATDTVCGFEALARLQVETLGVVSPLEFIPIAEKTKLIIPLGEMIIRQALSFAVELKSAGFGTLGMAINVSAIQLLSKHFVSRLFGAIAALGVEARVVTLEITESIFASNYQEINRILGVLQQKGLAIAVDDFGTGYSSLARERELHINCLKIDKFFIDKLMELSDEQAITGDVISMAHRLGHCVIAEGVEHQRQLEYLKRFSCDKIQGFLVSKPIDEVAAISLVKTINS